MCTGTADIPSFIFIYATHRNVHTEYTGVAWLSERDTSLTYQYIGLCVLSANQCPGQCIIMYTFKFLNVVNCNLPAASS